MRRMKSRFVSLLCVVVLSFGVFLSLPRVAAAQATFAHPEDVRRALRDLAAILGALAPPGSDVPDRMAQLQQQLDQLTFEQANALAEAINGPRLLATVEKLKTAVAAQQESLILASETSTSQAALTSTLDSPAYESACLPPRSPSATVLLGLIVARGVLEEAAIVADVVCQSIVVAAGFGGDLPAAGSCCK